MNDTQTQALSAFLKGAAMGAANIVPGVSGGTVAFLTGIYERLIHAIKSIGPRSLKLLLSGQLREFARAVDLAFLAAVGAGAAAGILSLAKLLGYLFERHAVFVWAFFFGLILASVLFVGAKVRRWSAGRVAALILGAAIAATVALLSPAEENTSLLYLLFCGVIAMASMIIPGLSGSFVLLLLGNYQLIMIDSVSRLASLDFSSLRILVPVAIGAVAGLVTLSHLLSWIFRRFHDHAVALLTGFVAGSLLVIWPWKQPVVESFGAGASAKEKVIGYDWQLPYASGETLAALAVMAAGFFLVWLMERSGATAAPPSAESRLE